MKIIKYVKKFNKIATLLSDMAHRTMFGLTDPNRFDFILGRISAKGAINIIHYGAQSVRSELIHCQNALLINNLPKTFEKPNLENLDNYISYFEMAAKIFVPPRKPGDKSVWGAGYGGKKWANISLALKNVCVAYKTYLSVPKDTDKEEKAIRDLLVQMNVFDGMAHNSGTVYNKMVGAEEQELYPEYRPHDQEFNEAKHSQLDNIERLRNISEADDPAKTLREIEKYINLAPYKDDVQKLKAPGSSYFRPGIEKEISQDIKTVSKRKRYFANIDDICSNANGFLIKVDNIIADIDNFISLAKRPNSKLIKTPSIIEEYRQKLKDAAIFLSRADSSMFPSFIKKIGLDTNNKGLFDYGDALEKDLISLRQYIYEMHRQIDGSFMRIASKQPMEILAIFERALENIEDAKLSLNGLVKRFERTKGMI